MIVGGGFAGLNAAKRLANCAKVSVRLIDQRNHHLFQPLLYQVATAGLNPSDIAVPIRSQFSRAQNVSVRLGKVTEVKLGEKWLAIGTERTPFDFLILACGAEHSYFGHPDWEEHAPGLKSVEQATEIRRRILTAFESAETETDPARQRSWLTFVIVGGGPTGVELAGALADISRTVLVRDFRRIDPASARIILVEAGPRILAGFAENLSARAEKDLATLGVEVRTNSRVERIAPGSVEINAKSGQSETIASENAFWAAGVQAAALGERLGVELDRAGRIRVLPDLSIPGYPHCLVAGDLAHLELEGGALLPGLAPAAIQTGRAAADAILASISGKPHAVFRYRDKGLMATIGKSRAITQVGHLRLTGTIAWFAWLFVHILYLIGFKNRVIVLMEWTWSYVFSKRGARLITSREWKLRPR